MMGPGTVGVNAPPGSVRIRAADRITGCEAWCKLAAAMNTLLRTTLPLARPNLILPGAA
ncbi:MAG TPA: hypothetical protein VNF69_08315 [Burkholderiales bacterium]|nr:hypothetical protein [Burkholderiales bacterium]